ncbi:MAG TPA: GGDEF domain-containing protein [Kofleriaceae bacterium]|nr:GGDEF domain-containing protein [Kofleriaceae bacterium]
MLTEREAADHRASEVVAELDGKVHAELRSGRGNGSSLRSSLRAAASVMSRRLIEIYAGLTGASEAPLRDELIAEITRQVTSFIASVSRSVRGPDAGAVARLARELGARRSIGIPRELDLAADDARRAATGSAPVPRRKQDKLGILDPPSLYADDFKSSVGILGVAVLFFDLDHFEALNTRFSEPVIDRTLLLELNQLVAELVAWRGMAYAEGGDEFVVLLPNTNAPLAAAFTKVLLHRIRSAAFSIDGHPLTVTASAGIATSTDPDGGQACREAAARAMRQAKDAGRDRYRMARQSEHPAHAGSA